MFEYVFPSFGCLIASCVFASPIKSLNHALTTGSLGNLNPKPWSVMTGNCLGWCAYAFYTDDPFVLAANLPGLILSFWLNINAAKVEYLQQYLPDDKILDDENDNTFHDDVSSIKDSNLIIMNNSGHSINAEDNSLRIANEHIIINNESDNSISRERKTKRIANARRLVSSPQDILFLRVVTAWSIILVGVGWLVAFRGYEQQIIGLLVNINLVFFYGAPLQTMKIVLQEKSSDSIHNPTVIMNIINALFWISYGLARNDLIIYLPNGVGLVLGIIQGILCLVYPPKR